MLNVDWMMHNLKYDTFD